MTALDDRRSASLLFDDELVDRMTRLDEEAMQHAEVRDAVAVQRVPSRLARALQRRALRRGALEVREHVVTPLVRAREAVLGKEAPGPPKVLVRVQGASDDVLEAHDALHAAGLPHCVALEPGALPDSESIALMRRRRVELALCTAPDAVEAGLAALQEHAVRPRVGVVAGDGPGWKRYGSLARRFDVVCADPVSIGSMGFHVTPQWRGGAVWMPSWLHGDAAAVLPVLRELVAEQAAIWVPVTVRADSDGLPALAELPAGTVCEWERFLDAAARAALVL